MHWIAVPSSLDELPPGAPAASAGWWALRFTPRVALLDEALLLEVSSTERLWGGRARLLSLIRQHRPAFSGEFESDGLAAPAQAQKPERSGTGTAPVPQEGRAAADDLPPRSGSGPALAQGATAFEALALLRLARADPPGRLPHRAPRRLPHDLPLRSLTALRPHAASLERMGCRTLGALRALPRAGVARRFGADVLRALDQAWGDVPHPLPWIELPECFSMSAELPALAESASTLLWSANRLLGVLHGWLQARQQGVLALELAWRHDLRRIDGVDLPAQQSLTVRTAEPTQDLAHLRRLLAEHLGRQRLAAPVNHITLSGTETRPWAEASASLLPPSPEDARRAQGEPWHQWVERVSARLGAQQVQVAVLQADHRPECMLRWEPAAGHPMAAGPGPSGARTSRARPAGAATARPARAAGAGAGDLGDSGDLGDAAGLGNHGNHGNHGRHGDPRPGAVAADAALWPGWLLRPPQRLALQGSRPLWHGPLRLLAGPHRFDGGWWDASQHLERRDYFVAHNDTVGTVWIFRQWAGPREAGRHEWFLHGVFG
ncbi:DNA polymerase Y family protein [Acidovorax sp. NCPPB 3576]|uniref:DNA polymerase Y family protein n=1 Tax=Acidovorax sp. NCPPB 3576 TaxID=2940488 RepID=UPI00234BF005|nr:DNA polymerase Y family protein [Acidovorax sp. NCPPB 3576]WCM86273.1 DNA polymerase Y family protein [Acidovorax sp. NCPPB 3576]